MSDTGFHNKFGQRLDVGDIVGWGHRDGNMSAQQVGIVLALTSTEKHGRTTTKAKCRWVLGETHTSSTDASTLFVLDPSSLGQTEYEAILAAADVIAAQAVVDDE